LYTTHRTLASIPGYVRLLLEGPVVPELSTLWAKRQIEDLRRWALRAVRVVVFVTSVSGLAVWVAAPVLYPVWTGRQLNVQPLLLAILIGQAILGAGWRSSVWSMLAVNRHRALARWWLANAVVTLGLTGFLTPRLGLSGGAIGSLLGDLACAALVFPILVS